MPSASYSCDQSPNGKSYYETTQFSAHIESAIAMTNHNIVTRTLITLATLLSLTLGRRCSVPVPFNSNLVGRRFFSLDECYRPATLSELRVNAESFMFKPSYVTRVFIPECPEKYVFRIRRNEDDPFVVRFPPLEFPGGVEGTNDELEKFCQREHASVKEKYFPVGNTRKMFKEAVRTIIKGATEIRDFGCFENEEGLISRVEGRAFTNVDLDGVITYLFGVAYQYNFCAESE